MIYKFARSLTPYIPAVAIAAAGLLAIGFTQLRPPERGTVIAIFHPGMSDYDVMAQISHGPDFIIAKGPAAHSYIIQSDEDNLPQRLKNNGAWLVLNYLGTAGCSAPTAISR